MRNFGLVCLICLLAAACGDATTDWVTVDESDAGRTISLGSADYLEVRLPGNLSTGYTWQILAVDGDVLSSLGGPAYESANSLAGADGLFTFEFQCAGEGTTTLELGYLRPWEDAPPIHTWSVTVIAS